MKIAIGMGIAALAYVFLMVFSFTLPSKEVLGTMSAAEINAIRVTPWIMIGLYFILTVAELFISPLGLSFVSKVAPPHLQGLMQGCWLAATAVGNSLLFIGGILYTTVPIWACWLVFVGATVREMYAVAPRQGLDPELAESMALCAVADAMYEFAQEDEARGIAKVSVGSVSETYTAPPELCSRTLADRAAHFRHEAGYYLRIGRWLPHE